MMKRAWLGVAALAGALVAPGAAAASGGSSIASAPVYAYGTLENGGGTHDEFWRLSTVPGDRLTLDIDFGTDPTGTNSLGAIDVWSRNRGHNAAASAAAVVR